MKKLSKIIVFVSASAIGCVTANADVIALYNFPSSQGTTLPSASSVSSSLATAGGLDLGAGFPTDSGQTSGISSSSGNPANSLFLRQANNSTETFAVNADKYITFSLTPSSAVDFTSIEFDYRRDSGSSATDYALRSDAGGDNFSTNIGSGTMSGAGTGSFTSASPLDLSIVGSLQNISSAVEFRLYIWGADSDSAITRFDNIEVNATLIPEPGAFALIASAAGLLLISFRRLRKAHS